MPGIHHVTAIAGDPLKNFDFYTRDLALRFVKKTVNFDDPSTYHFYYGDETGSPDTSPSAQLMTRSRRRWRKS
jgi:glyoxalase family protein